MLLAVWFMSMVEKRLRRVIPDALDLILTPFLTVIISGFIALLLIGRPVARSATAFRLSSARLSATPAGWRACCSAASIR
ncbi:PTS system protein [Klebsiella pneumoniae]|nr:PTS system protein [Klebsiella pneumoniae]